MKKLALTLFVSIFTFSISLAQKGSGLSVTIFGDSYSTFEGYLTPSHNEAWYFLAPPIITESDTKICA